MQFFFGYKTLTTYNAGSIAQKKRAILFGQPQMLFYFTQINVYRFTRIFFYV